MLNSANVHETILTPVICHKHVRCHDGVTLYFSVKFPSVAPKKTRNGYFSYMSEDLPFWSKNNQKKKKRKPWLDSRKHWESESINRNFSAAVLHVKSRYNNRNLKDIVISLQRADSGSYHFLVTGTKIFLNHLKTVSKLLENLYKIWWGETYHRRSAIESINVPFYVLIKKKS